MKWGIFEERQFPVNFCQFLVCEKFGGIIQFIELCMQDYRKYSINTIENMQL